MKKTIVLLSFLVSITSAFAIGSGGGCDDKDQRPPKNLNIKAKTEHIMEMTGKLYDYLDENSVRAAIVSRAGNNLSKRKFRTPKKQKYTHAGIAYKLKDGRWHFMHLLNECAGPTSRIYEQGLARFYMDDPHYYDFLVGIPSPELQVQMANVLEDKEIGRKGLALNLHNPKYSSIANPFSTMFQNSNMWVLSVIAAAQSGSTDRARTQEYYQDQGYNPSQVKLGKWEKAFVKMFAKNVQKKDHTKKEKRSRWFNFVSAASLHDYLKNTDTLVEKEFCLDQGCNIPSKKIDYFSKKKK